MSQSILTRSKPIHYPDSDGKPMADNTLQFRWIVKLEGGLDVLFTDDPNVFVAGDLLWYPVMGSPDIRQAPDAMVVFGRPKGDRGSYKQWEEDNIAPQVVCEVLSPRNYKPEMRRKLQFYETYGVEEYYVDDPDRVVLTGWRRQGNRLVQIPQMQGWTSPLLGIRFEIIDGTLEVFGPDGQRFLTYVELAEQRTAEKKQRQKHQRQAAKAKKQAEKAEQQAARNAEENARLREKLNALGLDPDA